MTHDKQKPHHLNLSRLEILLKNRLQGRDSGLHNFGNEAKIRNSDNVTSIHFMLNATTSCICVMCVCVYKYMLNAGTSFRFHGTTILHIIILLRKSFKTHTYGQTPMKPTFTLIKKNFISFTYH